MRGAEGRLRGGEVQKTLAFAGRRA
jgi:hypothetical protein